MTISTLIDTIEIQTNILDGLGLLSKDIDNLTTHWKQQIDNEPNRFINGDLSINSDALCNFRRLDIFTEDIPSGQGGLRAAIGGRHRSGRKILRDTLNMLIDRGYDELLKAYPCPSTGNPTLFKYKGYTYGLNWLKHIYLLGLMKDILEPELPSDFTCLDIGCSYGSYSGLVKKEFSKSHHILVDFPQHLLMAHYFLGEYHPGARIAGVGDVAQVNEITQGYVNQFDFVLVPCQIFDRLHLDGLDLVTNFVSFGEMNKEWFDYYVQSMTFRNAKYFFSTNRVQSSSTYDTDMNILNYPIHASQSMHFGVCPIQSRRYQSKKIWFFKAVTSPPIFEYIGMVPDV